MMCVYVCIYIYIYAHITCIYTSLVYTHVYINLFERFGDARAERLRCEGRPANARQSPLTNIFIVLSIILVSIISITV